MTSTAVHAVEEIGNARVAARVGRAFVRGPQPD
jgi:hypothetical protein